MTIEVACVNRNVDGFVFCFFLTGLKTLLCLSASVCILSSKGDQESFIKH